MLWIKTTHIFFVVSWFACLFYLPRLFVNHAQVTEPDQKQLLLGMEERLIKMMRFTFWGTVISAAALVYAIAGPAWQAYIQQGWFMVKMALVIILVFYHIYCIHIHRQFNNEAVKHSHVWFRVFNEMPVFLLFAVIYLVLAKPF